MATPALNVDHWAWPISDVEATYRFYTDVLELALVSSFTGGDWGKPSSADGRHFAFSQASKAEPDAHDVVKHWLESERG
ncbi:MAG TPA: VOC family protein [Steroidobacteraceae bacterium]|jgi:catechol 2,3-dioxygenase-like lactoylglutathione lyase family enzyme